MTAVTFSPYVYDVLKKVNRTLIFNQAKREIRRGEAELLLKDDSIYIFIELAFISLFFNLEFCKANQSILIKYWNDGFMKAKFRFSKTPSISSEEKKDIESFFESANLEEFLTYIQMEYDRAPNRVRYYQQTPVSSQNIIATNEERRYLKSFFDINIPL